MEQGRALTGQRAEPERLPVKTSTNEVVAGPMTGLQARRWGNRQMPADLKRAGFEVVVFRSDPDIQGSNYFRVSYGKGPGPNGKWS